MISRASCGYLVVTRECSARAVVFASPQVPRSSIEYDMSTSSATAAEERRSVSTTSKSSAASWTGPPPARSTELRTVRTTSSGCSSPKRHSRLPPVTSPAAPASPASWGPPPGGSGVPDVGGATAARLAQREHPPQRRVAQPAQGPRRELQAVRTALDVPL